MSIWKVSNLCFNSWSSKQSNWQCYQTTIRNLPSVGTEWLYKLAWWVFWDWGGVYMRKLAQARVSYCNDFLISYRVYWMTSSFHISLFEGIHSMVRKYMCYSKSQTLHMPLPVAVYRPTDFTLNVWLFPIEMILLWCFVPEWISHLGTSNRVNLPLRLLTWGDHGPMQMNWHLLVIINQLWYIKAPSCTSLKKIKNWMVNSKVHWYVS